MLVDTGLVPLWEKVPCSNLTPFNYIVQSPLILLSLPAGGHFVSKECNPGLSSYLIRIREIPELSRK